MKPTADDRPPTTQGYIKVEKSSTDCTDDADVRPILCEICVICGYLLCPTLTLTWPYIFRLDRQQLAGGRASTQPWRW